MEIDSMTMSNQLSGSTSIESLMKTEPEEPKKNVGEDQMAEFSSSIQDVLQGPTNEATTIALETSPKPTSKNYQKYPLNLNKAQFESLIAGLAAVVAVSPQIQEKIYEFMPNFFNDSGKLSGSGMAVTVLLTAVIFYFMRQFLMK